MPPCLVMFRCHFFLLHFSCIQMSTDKAEYICRCHCGRVQGRFVANKDKLIVWRCNCSDCFMRGNVHLVIPQDDFTLDMKEPLEEATTLYLWGTKTAVRRFCKTCGILPWYRPRSNPDGYAVTWMCMDLDSNGDTRPQIEIRDFDGQNWEECFQNSNIDTLSKK